MISLFQIVSCLCETAPFLLWLGHKQDGCTTFSLVFLYFFGFGLLFSYSNIRCHTKYLFYYVSLFDTCETYKFFFNVSLVIIETTFLRNFYCFVCHIYIKQRIRQILVWSKARYGYQNFYHTLKSPKWNVARIGFTWMNNFCCFPLHIVVFTCWYNNKYNQSAQHLIEIGWLAVCFC